jgi:hypothetical protein
VKTTFLKFQNTNEIFHTIKPPGGLQKVPSS